jgi:putative transposase
MDEALLKMEVIQSLLENSDRTTYTQKLKEAAEKLGKSVRTVRRRGFAHRTLGKVSV